MLSVKHHITCNCRMAALWETTGLGELNVSNVPHHSSGKAPGFMPVHCGSNLLKIRTFLVVS